MIPADADSLTDAQCRAVLRTLASMHLELPGQCPMLKDSSFACPSYLERCAACRRDGREPPSAEEYFNDGRCGEDCLLDWALHISA